MKGSVSVWVLAVLILIGCIGAGFVWYTNELRERQKIAELRNENNLRVLRVSLEIFFDQNRRYPASLAELTEEVPNSEGVLNSYTFTVRDGGLSYELCTNAKDVAESECVSP